MKRKLILIASLLGLLAGCSSLTPPVSTPLPTPIPPEYLPTIIAMTAEGANLAATGTVLASIPTDAPTETLVPTESPTPAPTATALPTATSTAIPAHRRAQIQFLAPGPMSRVISPVQLKMDVIAGDSALVQIDLFGEDGRLVSQIVRRVLPNQNGTYEFIKIPFEIPGVGELGRLTVSTRDKEGRITALNSVHILLLSSGANLINPAGNPFESVGVFSPYLTEPVFGGVMNVRGDVWPLSLQPVIFEVQGPGGKSLGLHVLTVEDKDPQLFEIGIPYLVTEPTLARLTIRQDDDRIPGLFYVYSQEVFLNP